MSTLFVFLDLRLCKFESGSTKYGFCWKEGVNGFNSRVLFGTVCFLSFLVKSCHGCLDTVSKMPQSTLADLGYHQLNIDGILLDPDRYSNSALLGLSLLVLERGCLLIYSSAKDLVPMIQLFVLLYQSWGKKECHSHVLIGSHLFRKSKYWLWGITLQSSGPQTLGQFLQVVISTLHDEVWRHVKS